VGNLRAIIGKVFAGDRLENWIAKMKKANIPVGYLRTVEEGLNAPEVRERHRLSRIPVRSAADPHQYNHDWNLAHDEFHAALVAACRNRTLLQVREQLFAKSARYRWLSVSMTSHERNLDAEHQAITDAGLNHDADKAAALLTIHIKETARLLAKSMDSVTRSASSASMYADRPTGHLRTG